MNWKDRYLSWWAFENTIPENINKEHGYFRYLTN